MDGVQTDEAWDDEPDRPEQYVDFAWGRTANPNTADGELQNIAAFANGFTRLTGARRTTVQVVVWLILLGLAATGVIAVVHLL